MLYVEDTKIFQVMFLDTCLVLHVFFHDPCLVCGKGREQDFNYFHFCFRIFTSCVDKLILSENMENLILK